MASRNVSVHVLIPTELHSWFKAYCLHKNTTMTKQLEEYIARLKQRENLVKEF